MREKRVNPLDVLDEIRRHPRYQVLDRGGSLAVYRAGDNPNSPYTYPLVTVNPDAKFVYVAEGPMHAAPQLGEPLLAKLVSGTLSFTRLHDGNGNPLPDYIDPEDGKFVWLNDRHVS